MSIAARNAILAGGGSQPSGGYWGLCFTAEQANSTVRISKSGKPVSMTILYSTDAVNWSAYTIGTDIVLENVGDKVWMKAGEGGNSGGWFTTVMNYYRFKMTGLIAASGNLMSIVDGETETFTAKKFQSLFQGCTALTTAPALPATTLATYCYDRMFSGCTALTTVEVGFAAFSPTDATTDWLNGVAATGTFYCPTALGTDATITRGVSACPEGWTVITTRTPKGETQNDERTERGT